MAYVVGGVGVVDVDRLRACPFGGGRGTGTVSVGEHADLGPVGLDRSLPFGERRGLSETEKPPAGRDELIGGGDGEIGPLARVPDAQLDGLGDGGWGDGVLRALASAFVAAEASALERARLAASAYDADGGGAPRIVWSPCAHDGRRARRESAHGIGSRRARAKGMGGAKGLRHLRGRGAVCRFGRVWGSLARGNIFAARALRWDRRWRAPGHVGNKSGAHLDGLWHS